MSNSTNVLYLSNPYGQEWEVADKTDVLFADKKKSVAFSWAEDFLNNNGGWLKTNDPDGNPIDVKQIR